MQANTKTYMTVPEVAEKRHVTVRRWINNGWLEAVMLPSGTQYRISQSAYRKLEVDMTGEVTREVQG